MLNTFSDQFERNCHYLYCCHLHFGLYFHLDNLHFVHSTSNLVWMLLQVWQSLNPNCYMLNEYPNLDIPIPPPPLFNRPKKEKKANEKSEISLFLHENYFKIFNFLAKINFNSEWRDIPHPYQFNHEINKWMNEEIEIQVKPIRWHVFWPMWKGSLRKVQS